MSQFKGFANVVYPTDDLQASVAAWTAILDQEPAFVGDDFAGFTGKGVEVALSSAPWVDHPLVFWKVDNLEEAREELISRGAVPMGEVADGSLAELGTAKITNGDPKTGIVDVGAGKLAVLKAADGNLVALTS
ncbi:hypothetical protein Rhe02_01540 [Rhizocola hellebori]|uniref:VOC domain-containing protein n=1 Tax=Rhizocola hellebori TaxID=1392758 RepID=A0A8J3Q256_9ACTN|nr:hypothetical protein [Rhizocola hellebori]GIH02087.1 hypothetical protein Rhe02_01540 [Rhizocola hellebori]